MKFSDITDLDERKEKVEYIDRRWVGAFEQYRESTSETAKYLMAVNSGGSLATLGFMGAMKTTHPLIGTPSMLGLFLIGIVLVGLGRILATYRLLGILSGWREAISEFYQGSIDWQDVLNRDAERLRRTYVIDVLAWSSFACFVVALLIGGAGILGS